MEEEDELQTRSGMRHENCQSGQIDVSLLRLGGSGGGPEDLSGGGAHQHHAKPPLPLLLAVVEICFHTG